MRGGTPQAGRHAAAQLQVSSSCRRYPTLLERQVVDRRQLTGKMKSTALAIGMSGTASPRRTIVLSLAKANSVILESPERDVKRPFRPKSSTVLGGTHCGTGERYLVLCRGSRVWDKSVENVPKKRVSSLLQPHSRRALPGSTARVSAALPGTQ